MLRRLVRAHRGQRATDQRGAGTDVRRRGPGRGCAYGQGRQTRSHQAGATASHGGPTTSRLRHPSTTPLRCSEQADSILLHRPKRPDPRQRGTSRIQWSCAGNWAGTPRAPHGRRVFTIYATRWWSAGSRPGTPKASTSTPTSQSWRLTSDTSKPGTSTGTSPLSRS